MPISTPAPLAEAYKDGEHFPHVLQYLFKPALEKAKYEVILPTAVGADVIQASIIKNLEEADLVLCDISALNPNVFFELGIRTALNRPVALVRDNFTPQIPFDTNSINTHTYNAPLRPWTVESEISKLTAYITAAATQANGTNSMWRVFGIREQAKPAEIENLPDAKLDLLMTQVSQLARELERNSSLANGTVYVTGTPVVYGGSIPAYTYGNTLQSTNYQVLPWSTATATTSSPYSNLINPAPKKFENFIDRAKAIAQSESASLTVAGYDAKEDTVVLSSGSWRLSEDNVKRIDRLSGTLKVKFRLLMTPQ